MGRQLTGLVVGNRIVLDDPRAKLMPQPEPTSPRIKALLGRALTKPDSLTPSEVQELAASVVYHLIMRKKD